MLMPNFFALKRFLNCTPTVGGYLVVYRLNIASCIHHSGKPTLPLSLPPSTPPTPNYHSLCWKTLMLHAVGDVDDDNDDGDGGGGCADDDSVI